MPSRGPSACAARDRRLASWLLTLLVLATPVQAEQAATPAKPKEPAAVAAIPVASIAVEAATLDSFLKSVEADLEVQPSLTAITDELPDLDSRVVELTQRTEAHLEGGYDRADLDSLNAAWRSHATELASWESALAKHLANLDKNRSHLIDREGIWQATATSAGEEQAPREVHAQISRSLGAIKTAERALRENRDTTLGLQKRVVALHGRVSTELDSLAVAREAVLTHVLSRNAPPVWGLRLGDVGENQKRSAAALEDGRAGIARYARRSARKIWLHLVLVVLMIWVSWMARSWVERPPLQGTRPVPDALTHPGAAGLVLGLSMTVFLHVDAPPQLRWLLSLVVLPFWFPVLRSLLPDALRRPLIGLIVLILLDFGRRLLMQFDSLSQGLLVLESSIAFVGLVLLRRPTQLAKVPRPESLFWVRVLGAWLHLTLFGAALSLGGAILGWTSLADLVLSSLVIGTFVGSILFTAVRVIEAIAEASAYSGKLDGVRILRYHRQAFLRVLSRVTRAVAFATWIYRVLEGFTIRDSVLAAATNLLETQLGYGSLQITLGGLAAFPITIWISWLLARFIATALEDEVFTRVTLARGIPESLSTMSRYAILVVGFIFAVAALGFEVGNLALLVSALGVGIGFGMQNMVNNFISGLILLFERPITEGDMVSLDQLLGSVTRIGIRSSTIRTFDGADVIVPNGDLISNQVTNWTLTDSRRRVIVPVGVQYGTPARRVIELLVETARAHPAILDDPTPYALFIGFGDSSLDFELRAWTESSDALTIVRSDLTVGVQDALAAAGIEVPFPQRDLHVKTLPEQPGKA